MIVELLIITSLALVIGGLIGYKLGFKYYQWQMIDDEYTFFQYLIASILNWAECTALHPCPKCREHEKSGYASYQHEMNDYADDIETQSAMHDIKRVDDPIQRRNDMREAEHRELYDYDISNDIIEYNDMCAEQQMEDMHDEHGNKVEG